MPKASLYIIRPYNNKLYEYGSAEKHVLGARTGALIVVQI